MRRSLKVVAMLFVSLPVLWTSMLFAQAVGIISGTVKDSTGAVIPGATITSLNEGTGVTRDVVTDASGHYVLPLLPVGTYTISAASTGLRTAENREIKLEVQQSRMVDFTLQVTSISTEVTVTSQMAQVEVQRSDATLGQTIHEEQVADLPLNGRDFVQLALLGPGTVTNQPGGFMSGGASSEVSYRGTVSLSAQGMRENANDWMYDGVDDNELTAGGVSILPSVDAIREFKVLTYNYSAQYGARGGTTVLVSSKSGTNNFHGTLFEYLRNDLLDARNFFDGAQKGEYKQNEYGFSLGGPIRKDKTFFFTDFQANRIRQGLTILSTVPTALMRQGYFTESFPNAPAAAIYDPTSTTKDPVTGQYSRNQFQGNIIPPERMSPIGKALVNLFPLPTYTDRLGSNYLSNPVKQLDDYLVDARVDHNFSDADRLFTRFTRDNAAEYLPGGLPDFGSGNSSNQWFTTHARNVAISETHMFSAKIINAFTAGYNRDFNYILSFGYGTNEAQKLGIPGANLGSIETSGMTAIAIQNFNGLGDRIYAPYTGGTNVYHLTDAVAIVHGAHQLNSGFTTRFMQLNLLGNSYYAGRFAFDRLFTAKLSPTGTLDGTTGNPVASLLMGIPTSGSRNNELNGSVRGRRWKEYRGFMDDIWTVNQSLTLNLGLAYSVTTPLSEAANRFSGIDFATGKIYVAGQNSDPAIGVKTDFSNVEPRIGFAWSTTGKSNMAIRGGYGIFHDSSAQGGSNGPVQNPPYSNAYAFTSDNITANRTLATGFPDNSKPVDPAIYTGDWHNYDVNFKQGLIQQWNLNFQRSLPSSTVVSVAYTGTHGTRLMDKNFNLDTATPGSGNNPAARRPYPQYNSILITLSRGWLMYHSMQVRVERRAAKGLYLLGSYTYSKALSNGLKQEITGDPGADYYPLTYWPNADKGLAATDLRHNFTLSYLYKLPFGKGEAFLPNLGGVSQAIIGGWQFNGITTVRAGFPLGPTMSTNQSGTGLTNRPNQVCSGSLAAPSVSKWFDTSCFVAPAVGTLGNAARTPGIYGPGQINFDMSMYKTFAVTEGSSVQLRSEFFNIFNHAEFSTPNVSVGNANYGRITSTARSSRQIQFALKFVF